MRWHELRDGLINAGITFVAVFAVCYGYSILSGNSWTGAFPVAIGVALLSFGGYLMQKFRVRIYTSIPESRQCWRNGVNKGIHNVARIVNFEMRLVRSG